MTVGYTAGVFDMFNIEHLYFLKKAKEECDKLIVGIYVDELIQGKTPIISIKDRMEIVRSCRFVDDVVLQKDVKEIEIYKEMGCTVFFVGNEFYDIKNEKYRELIIKEGINIIDIRDYKEISDTEKTSLLNYLVNNFTQREQNAKTRKKYNIGYTTGCFDMFHVGHLNILKKSKELCEYLIVGVSVDDLVKEYKGHPCAIPFEERAAILANVRYVDRVVPQKSLDKSLVWKELKYDVLFHGSDYKGSNLFSDVSSKLEKHGVETIFFDYTDGISSTIIRARI